MKKHRRGFTLIELLVAILIFSIIVTVIYSTFSTGTSVWKRTKIATQTSMNINSVLEDLVRDLRGAVPYNDGPEVSLEFIGEKDRLYFCHLSDTISEDSYYTEVYRSSYFTKSSSKESGKVDLLKRKAPLIKGGFNIDEIKEQNLISGMDDFKIEYAYNDPDEEEIVWEEAWEKKETEEISEIPVAIRINISKGNIILTRHIWVPTGELVDLETD